MTTVADRTRCIPGREDSTNRKPELVTGILREFPPGTLEDHRLIRLGYRAQLYRAQLRRRNGSTHGGVGIIEVLRGNAQHGLAEHLDQTSIGVPGESLIGACLGQPGYRHVVEPDIEHRVHHPGHRHRRARAHRDQQRIVRIAKHLANRSLHPI